MELAKLYFVFVFFGEGEIATEGDTATISGAVTFMGTGANVE